MIYMGDIELFGFLHLSQYEFCNIAVNTIPMPRLYKFQNANPKSPPPSPSSSSNVHQITHTQFTHPSRYNQSLPNSAIQSLCRLHLLLSLAENRLKRSSFLPHLKGYSYAYRVLI
ncbi:hypothetical protein L1887_44369 [Cichorium endivia]|nr:hypothetical protein L1887_44369 [Cichorium endivia]